MSVQKLSSPNEDPIFDKRVLKNPNENLTQLISFNRKKTNEASNDWREIVRKRIEAKTKIKIKTQPKNPKTKENKFNETYGYFFFPLLRSYDV